MEHLGVGFQRLGFTEHLVGAHPAQELLRVAEHLVRAHLAQELLRVEEAIVI